MTPKRFVAALDRQIAAHGQPVTLSRVIADASDVVLPLRAVVRYGGEDDLTAEITIRSITVIISSSALRGTPFESGILRQSDAIQVDGKVRQIRVVDPIRLGTDVVRWTVEAS